MKRLLVLLGLIVAGLNSKAQIVHHDINPDSTFGGGPALTQWVLQPPPSPAELHVLWNTDNSVYIRMHGSAGMGEILTHSGFPAKLSADDAITPEALTWLAPTSATGSLHENGNGNWRSDASDKYLGFRIKSFIGGWHYGWLKLTVAAGATSFTVKEWAYQSVENRGINAGQLTPTGITPIVKAPGIDISVYNGRIYPLRLEDGITYTYAITDMQGRSIGKGYTRADESISTAGFASGMYIFRISGGRYERRLKFILQ